MTLPNVNPNDKRAGELVSNFTAKTTQTAETRTHSMGFDHYLQVKDNKQNVSKPQESRRSPSKDKSVKQTPAKKESVSEDVSYETTQADETTSTAKASKPEEVNETTATTATSKEVEDAEKDIVAKVADALQVPVEAVMQWLAELNLQPLDLTDPQAVSALLQKAFGVNEPVMLLKTPEFHAAFEVINEAMAEYKPLADAVKLSNTFAQLEGLTVITDDENQPVVVATAEVTEMAATTITDTNEADLFSEDGIPDPAASTATRSTTDVVQNTAQKETSSNANGDSTANNNQAEIGQEIEPLPVVMTGTPFESAAARIMEASSTQVSSPVDAANIMNQIMSRVRTQSGDQFAELKITLRPENLGDVTLKVSTLNGVVTAQFIAENQRVKEVLESNFNQLKDVLQQQGVNISELSVSVGQDDTEERMNQFLRAQQSGRRRMQRITSRTVETETEDMTEQEPSVNPSDSLLTGVDVTA